MSAQKYAKNLIERYNSMKTAFGEKRLHQIFLGAKASVANYPEDVRQAYDLAEKELFPQTSVMPGEPTPNTDLPPKQGQVPKPSPRKRPTTADLYNAWKTGGKAKLMETLPDEPDPEDE